MHGSSADVVIYGTDTFSDFVKKINDAIAFGLGQGTYVNNARNFSTISDGTANTSESVYRDEPIYSDPVFDQKGNMVQPPLLIGYTQHSTLLIRSAIPGLAGELKFAGDEDLLKALGLATIQESRESEFNVTVYDAHNGKLTTPSQRVSGNVVFGAITDSVDVWFDPMANINATWNEEMKRYDFSRGDGTYMTVIHLSDNTTFLQTGANEAEHFNVVFGDMSASALGLDGLLLISRETAARSITILDNAISRVSKQRASLGAYINRLEHAVANITAAGTNLTAAESRIRDADMAKEMMELTKLNILSQAGMSMLSQANQTPQNILNLLR